MQIIVYVCNMEIFKGLNSILLRIPHIQSHTEYAYIELTWISVILCIADTDILSRNATDMCQNVGEAREAIGKKNHNVRADWGGFFFFNFKLMWILCDAFLLCGQTHSYTHITYADALPQQHNKSDPIDFFLS